MLRAAVAIVCAGIGTLAWHARDTATARLKTEWKGFLLEVEHVQSSGNKTNPEQPAVPGNPAFPAAPEEHAAQPASHTAPAAPTAHAAHATAAASSATEPPDATSPAPPPAAEMEMDIVVYGVVYDLATKKPVPRARITFRTKETTIQEVVTDMSGHYAVQLHKNFVYVTTAMIAAPGYRKGLLEDRDPPLRERSPEDRAALISETIDSDLDPVPVRYPQNAQLAALDLVLVPEKPKEK